MLTKEEIKNTLNFNISSVKEGLRQAEQRLNDSFVKKENLEKKAFTLLSMFLSFSTFLFSVPRIFNVEENIILIASLCTGLSFLIGAIFLFLSLKAKDYGTMGRYPDTWLQNGVLDGDDNMQAYVLANVLFDYQKSIETSDESNKKKVKLVDKGIIFGVISPILFLLCLLIPCIFNILACIL